LDTVNEVVTDYEQEIAARAGALLQYGSDVTIAVAMGGFSAVLWIAPAADITGSMWELVRVAISGFAGMWAAIAHIRFQTAWKQATKGRNRGTARLVTILALTGAIAAVMAVFQYAKHQKVAAACERAESAGQTQLVGHPICREYFGSRAASDFETFKPLE